MSTIISETLATFRQVATDPMASVRRWKDEHPGAKAIGFFSGYIPEEVIIAAGALPVRMILPPDPGSIAVADQYAQTFTCSYVRGCLDQAIAGHYDPLDGVVFPKTCETLTFMREVWRRHVPQQWVGFHQAAAVTNTAAARQFSRVQLDRFIADIEAFTGQAVSDERLAAAIAACNAVRGLLREINQSRRADPPPLGGADALAVALAAQVLAKDEARDKLRALREALRDASPGRPDGRARIMLSGSNVDNLSLLEAIEAQNARIVADDLSTTTRHYWDDVATDRPPREALVARYLGRIPDSSRHPTDRRIDHVLALAQDYAVQGAIFITRKYCETHLYEYPYVRDRLAAIGVPTLFLETEHHFTSLGQIMTRVGAFVEVLV